jgi:hypothetical protein
MKLKYILTLAVCATFYSLHCNAGQEGGAGAYIFVDPCENGQEIDIPSTAITFKRLGFFKSITLLGEDMDDACGRKWDDTKNLIKSEYQDPSILDEVLHLYTDYTYNGAPISYCSSSDHSGCPWDSSYPEEPREEECQIKFCLFNPTMKFHVTNIKGPDLQKQAEQALIKHDVIYYEIDGITRTGTIVELVP